MKLIAFRALQGDSFLLQSGDTNILVDAGMPNTFGQISAALSGRSLTAVFISHVDYDHLGALFNLIKEAPILVKHSVFYMNTPHLATEYQGEEVGFKHGDSLQELLIKCNKSFQPLSKGRILDFKDIEIEVLWPTPSINEELYKNWNSSKILEENQYTYLKRQQNNGDIINKSSLVLLLSYKDNSILFLGDSHPETICKSLMDKGYSNTSPLKLDLLKLSHHGSKHNTSIELLRLIRCDNFYISTNGGKYGHPDKELIELIQSYAVESKKIINVYLNYDIEIDIKEKCTIELTMLKFKNQNELEFI
ncbi:ComEC/Rec2 family competence protein [Shewanella woodyi]|uniref:Beta-lactamase domain protein n=1 Tax=Shewanella woodyi (strain ATCC 51908 / MS32) TaxID=392500 RepID=B1KGD9_SHEWM|nr:MBL fold metallo-hydrolase [Shewanella woodyi]ACA88276.1 beta-lactamase domain protein [Shewanella woodyi ATCC 51908]